MFLYTILEALVGIIAGILIAKCTRKYSYVTYGFFDNLTRVTNVILLIAYVCLSPFYMFIGMICSPAHDGILGLVGWIVSIICASSALFCGLGIGLSVSLRKKGDTGLSFLAQFIGAISIGVTVLCYMLFEGNLLATLN